MLPFGWREEILALKGIDFKVWMTCYWWSEKDDTFDLTLAQLVAATGYSETHIKKARKRLRARGYFKTVKHRDSGGRYSIPVEWVGVPGQEPELQNVSSTVTKGKPGEGQKVTLDEVTKGHCGTKVTKGAASVNRTSVSVNGRGNVAVDIVDAHARGVDVVTDAVPPIPQEIPEQERKLIEAAKADLLAHAYGGSQEISDFEACQVFNPVKNLHRGQFKSLLKFIQKHKYWSGKIFDNDHGDSPVQALAFSLASPNAKSLLAQWARIEERRPTPVEDWLCEHGNVSESCADCNDSDYSYLEGEIDFDDKSDQQQARPTYLPEDDE